MNGEATRNRLYPDQATLLSRMAASPVLDGAAQVFLSPAKKMLVMCGSSISASPTFVLFDAVLGVPEGDVAMYDGSSSQWNQYSVAKIKAAGASASQAATWAFDAVTPGTSAPRAVGTLPAAVPGENPFVPGNFVYSPGQNEMNQIEAADKAYISATEGGSTPPAAAAAPPAAAAEARRHDNDQAHASAPASSSRSLSPSSPCPLSRRRRTP